MCKWTEFGLADTEQTKESVKQGTVSTFSYPSISHFSFYAPLLWLVIP